MVSGNCECHEDINVTYYDNFAARTIKKKPVKFIMGRPLLRVGHRIGTLQGIFLKCYYIIILCYQNNFRNIIINIIFLSSKQ